MASRPPGLSPNGKKIVFGGTEGARAHEIYAVDAKTGRALHALTSCAGSAPSASTTCRRGRRTGRRSPSSTRTTTFAVANEVVDEQVWVMDDDGGNQQQLTTTRPRTRSPIGAPTVRRSSTPPAAPAPAGSGSSMPTVRTNTRSAVASRVTRGRAPRAMTGARPGRPTARRSRSCATSRASASPAGPCTR